MGLEKDSGRVTYVNIKEGKLYTKEKGGEPDFFQSLSGTIVKVDFKQDEYNGKKYEVAQFTIVDKGERFLLQMRTDSGYFRGFCNSLRTGDPTMKVRISASHKLKDGKPQTTCFVTQSGKPLKHAFTKDNMGELPPVESREWKGDVEWDGSKQIEFWKKWLLSLTFVSEFLAEGETEFDQPGTESGLSKENSIQNPAELKEPLDDLPF